MNDLFSSSGVELPEERQAPEAPSDVVLRFTVYGRAATAGSKQAFPFKRKDGSLGVSVTADNERTATWAGQISDVVGPLMAERELLDCALDVTFVFYRARNKGHFGKRGLLPSAPMFPSTKPDLTKLVRAVEDAMNKVVWRDDARICSQHNHKRWGEPERLEVQIRRMEP